MPNWFELYVSLEAAASRLRRYDESLIPGILQTKEYAHPFYRLGGILSEEERERAVQVRLQRQALLFRRLPSAPRLESVLSEAVLTRSVDGPAVMTAQLDRPTKVAELPNVSVRVLPLAVGPQPGAVAGSFVILDFPATKGGRAAPEPSMVYSESLTGALYLDKPDELAAYERVWRGLDALSLGEADSTDMIKNIAGEMRHD